MIRSFRKLFLFLTAIFTGFVFAGNVFAFSKGDSASHIWKGHNYAHFNYKCGNQKVSCEAGKDNNNSCNVSCSNDTYTYDSHQMTLDKVTYDAYCLDAIRYGSSTGSKFVVERVLNPNDAKDAVILNIINSEGSYQAKALAIRAFLPYTKDYSSSTAKLEGSWLGQLYGVYANYNSGFVWGAEDIESMFNILGISYIDKPTGTAEDLYKFSKMGTPYKYGSFNPANRLVDSSSEATEAKKLFLAAIKEGSKVALGKKISLKSVSWTQPVYENDSFKMVDVNNVKRGSRTVKFDLTFSKFNDEENNDKVTINVIPDAAGKMVSLTQEYHVLGTPETEWKSFDNNTDFRSLLTSASVTINIRVRVASNVVSGQAFKYNFGVKVGYEDPKTTELSGALVIYDVDRNSDGFTDASRFQRYYVGTGTENPSSHQEKPFSVEMTWSDTPQYCENVVPNKNNPKEFKEYISLCCRGNNDEGFNIKDECEKATKSGDEAAKAKWCKLKEEYCDYCNDTITIPETCSEISPDGFVTSDDKVATINGPKDVKVCVMDGIDQANHSYNLTKKVKLDNDNSKTYSYATNKYCNVSCKEDYKITLPTARYANSGRYFTFKLDIEAEKTCYSDIIDYQSFNEDISKYSAIINQHIAAGTVGKNNQEFKNAVDEYNKAVKDIKACSAGWDGKEYEFEPEIEFDYQEDDLDVIGSQALKLVHKFGEDETKKVYEKNAWYCTGSDVDSTYSSCIGGQASSTVPTRQVNLIKCDDNYTNCQTTIENIPTANYAKKTTRGIATYAPEALFFTKYSTGIIKYNPDGSREQYTKLAEILASKIPDADKKNIEVGGMPIELKTGKGVYSYGFKFKNVGEYFDSEGAGRLIGDKESVAFVNGDTQFKGVYVCSYVVNCKECKVQCGDPNLDLSLPEDLKKYKEMCNIPDDDCPGCKIKCEGACIYDPEYGQLFTVHQTSLTDFNPSNRNLGSNLSDEKGQAFIAELESNGESIYEEPEYSFVFTPAAIEFIRNEINANSDSYTDLPNYWEDKSKYVNYSELVCANKGASSQECQDAKKHDYKIYHSSVLDELANKDGVVIVNPLADSRSKVQSWLDSDYCRKQNHNCAISGAMGPAYK